MAEWTSAARQIVQPGEAIVFTDNPIPCIKGYIRSREDSGYFNLNGNIPTRNTRRCCCMYNNAIQYHADFGANIAVPEGETVGEISVAYQIGNATLQGTTMIVTPAAVEEFFNISRSTSIAVFKGCCQNFAIINTSDIPIAVVNANVEINPVLEE